MKNSFKNFNIPPLDEDPIPEPKYDDKVFLNLFIF